MPRTTGDAQKLPQGTDPFAVAFRGGLLNLREGDAHSAARAFERALQIRPHAVQARINLGFAYIELDKPFEAEGLFARSIEMAPRMANAYYGLAEALEARGDLEGAVGAMRTFVHLTDQEDPFRRRALAALWEWQETMRNRPPEADRTDPVPPIPETPKSGIAILDAPLQTLDGATAALANHSGKVLVVNVWATWCGPCRVELPSLARLAQHLDEERFAVIGVSMDRKRFVAAEYLRSLGIPFNSYWDPSGALTRDIFDARSIPLTVIVSPEGKVIASHQGARDWSHPDIVTALKQLTDPAIPQPERIARLKEGLR